MGLFGSIFKGIGKAVGGIAKIGSFALKSGLVPLPFGGTAGRLVGGLLASKAPGGHSQLKLQIPPLVLRGKSVSMKPITLAGGARMPTATQLRRSPVMPGGAVATKSGTVNRPATAPLSLGGSSGGLKSGGRKRKRRRIGGTSTRRSYRKSSGRKRTRRRKLKFGSAAWRKKYLGHGRKRRRRAA